MLADAAGQHIADRQQIRTAMVIDHALRIAGGARRIVQRDRVPFVVRHLPDEIRIAAGEEILILDRAQSFALAAVLGIVIIDHQRLHLGEPQRLLHHLGELAVDDQHLGLSMIELESDHRGVEPRIDGVEHRAAHRHAVMAFEHGGRIGEHRRDGVAARHAALVQGRRQPACPRVEVAVAPPQRAVHDRGTVGEDRGRALQKRQRGQRLEVGRGAVEIGVVGVHGRASRPTLKPSEAQRSNPASVRFRSSHHYVARPFANFGMKDTSNLLISCGFGSESAYWTRRNDADF